MYSCTIHVSTDSTRMRARRRILDGVSGTFLVYSGVLAKSDKIGLLLFFQLICMVCGRELTAKALPAKNVADGLTKNTTAGSHFTRPQ